ncbi:MAG: transposase [Actinomycetota bacterium]
MARARRTDLVQPFLHIYSRGADQQDIFSADHDRRLLEQLMAEASERHAIGIHALAFMYNHFHVIVDRRSGGDVSAALQFALGRYALAYNAAAERTGPLFTGRFGATEIETSEQLLQCSRYLHLNPLEFVPLAAITSYRWSTLSAYAGRREAPPWLTTDYLPSLYHRSAEEYVEFVLAPQASDRYGRPVQPWQTLTLTDVDDAVRHHSSGVRQRAPRRGVSDSTLLAITAAVQLRVEKSAAIAAHHGLGSCSSARTAARRGRVRAARDEAFRRRLNAVLDRLRFLADNAGLTLSPPSAAA